MFRKPAIASWKTALQKPPPTLAQKLGVNPSAPVMVAGALSDALLIEAVSGATTGVAEDAASFLAEVRTAADLSAALALAHSAPHLPIWCVGVKGKSVWQLKSSSKSP